MRAGIATGILTFVIVWAGGGSVQAAIISGLAGSVVGAVMLWRFQRAER